MAFQDDIQKASDGVVPWDVDECLECLLFCQDLEQTPVDDWNLQPHEVTLGAEITGKPTKVSLNMFDGLTQVTLYLTKRYPWNLSVCHGIRAMQIAEFLEEHRERLADDGFIENGPDGEPGISRGIIHALATLPFTREVDGEEGHVYKTFDYELVAAKARELNE